MRIDLNFSKYRGQRASEFWQRVEERLQGSTRRDHRRRWWHVPAERRRLIQPADPDQGTRAAAHGGRLAGRLPVRDARLLRRDRPAASRRAATSPRATTWATRQSASVVIVNRTHGPTLLEQLRIPWASRFRRTTARTWSTIVGVVADTRQQLSEPVHDEVYVPMFQTGLLSTNWLVRSAVDPSVMQREIRNGRARHRSRSAGR